MRAPCDGAHERRANPSAVPPPLTDPSPSRVLADADPPVVSIHAPPSDWRGLVDRIHARLVVDDVEGARRTAQALLALPESPDTPQAQAHALLCLGYCDQRSGRLRRALHAGRRAAELFRSLGEDALEGRALSTVCLPLSFMGQNQQACEAAFLAVTLADHAGTNHDRVVAHHHQGTVLMWARQFTAAAAAFARAVDLAEGQADTFHPLRPLCNRIIGETIRIVDARFAREDVTSLVVEQQRRLDAAFARLGSEDDGLRNVAAILWSMQSLCAVWAEDVDRSRAALARSVALAVGLPSRPHLLVWDAMVESYLAALEGDAATSVARATRVVDLAHEQEHEQFAILGHMVLAERHDAHGEFDLAQEALRRLRRRERRIADEGLEHAAEAARWRFRARRQERHLEVLEEHSRLLEKLSFEDPLTGLSNRRRFDELLACALEQCRQGGPSSCLAVLDVDRFKAINDRLTHAVGDLVLQGIATVVERSVRDRDVVARWAGDEFAVLFPDTHLDEAGIVCDRLAAALAAHDWTSVASGLAVGVSIGVAQSEPDDTVQSLFLRSDVRMYAVKDLQRGATE